MTEGPSQAHTANPDATIAGTSNKGNSIHGMSRRTEMVPREQPLVTLDEHNPQESCMY